VIGAFVLVGLANGPLSAVLGVAAIEATPDGMRGRVLGAQNALVLAAPALLAAPMAAVATGYGLQVGGLALAAVIVVGTVVALFAPAFRGLDGLASSSTADADPGAEGADPGLGDAGPETGTTSESVPASAS
jgi:MFS family permease